jgi:hypothetical protein
MEKSIYSFFNLFNLGARWSGWSSPRPGRFIARKETGSWVDSSAGLDGKSKDTTPHRNSIPGISNPQRGTVRTTKSRPTHILK